MTANVSIDDVKSYIPSNHPCFLVEKIAGQIDFTDWEAEHWDKPGHPAYHPRVLLRGVVMGYIDGIKSGRELARRAKTDLSYIYLCGLKPPDFRTFNRFYKEFSDVIVFALVLLINFAKTVGMKTVGVLAVDSTGIKANNLKASSQIKSILQRVCDIIE